MSNLLGSAGTKENLEKMINNFYFSTNCTITENNEVYNSKLDKILTEVKVVVKGKRWRFEMV